METTRFCHGMGIMHSDVMDTFLSVTSHIKCIVAHCLINVVYLTACCLYQVMMTLYFLSDVTNDGESTQNQQEMSQTRD